MPETRQIFTLFHELAHLLLGTGGIDTRLENYINFLQGNDRAIEVLCNSFGGEFLVPDSDFDKRIKGITINDTFIQQLSNLYNVSREVILRKLLDKNYINRRYYKDAIALWASKPRSKKGVKGNYYLTRGAYLGRRYIEKTFSKYYQERISKEQLADYLNVKVRNVSGMESLVFNKGADA